MPSKILQLDVGSMQNFCYVVISKGECCVIDPGWDAENVKQAIKNEGCSLKYVILTHSHYDHAQEAKEFDAQVVCHESSPLLCDVSVSDDTTLPLGDEEIHFIHTPGHIEDAMCVKIGNDLFTGDTVFVGRVGRVDLPGSDSKKMKASIEKLKELPDETIVWPGHDYGSTKSSTIGREKKENPYFG